MTTEETEVDDFAVLKEAGVKGAVKGALAYARGHYQHAAIFRASFNPAFVSAAVHHEALAELWQNQAMRIMAANPKPGDEPQDIGS